MWPVRTIGSRGAARWLAAAVLAAAGCVSSGGGGGGAGDMASGSDPFSGGSVTVAGCGYSLSTRDGASVPVPGSPVFGADPTPWGVHLTLPAADAATSIAVTWQDGDTDTLATTVQYGEGGATDRSVDGYTFQYQLAANDAPRTLVRIHQVHLCGLKPNTVYSYRAGGRDKGGQEKWSALSTFHTAPAKGSASTITVGVLGDSRGNFGKWGTIAQALAAATPDVIFFSGDAVDFGQSQKEWDQFFTQGAPLLSKIAIVSAHGNHESNAVHFYSQYAQPRDGANFGIDYGAVHLTVLNDTTIPSTDWKTTGTSFLGSDLGASDGAAWKMVMHHQPMYSSAAAHGSNLDIRAAWLPLIDQHKVDLVLAGHDHDYERSKPLRGDAVQAQASSGTTYLVAGGAGALLYDSGTSSWTAYSKSSYSYATVRLAGKALDLKAFDDLGTTLDTLSYSKP